MGSGKTCWSIQHLNENGRKQNFLYITPFLDEVKRIKTATGNMFKEPLNKGNGKCDDLNNLIACEENIVATHELFKHIDSTTKELLNCYDYTLILDEVLNVIEPYTGVKKDDLKLLQGGNYISVDDDGYIIWNKDYSEYDTVYNEFKELAESRSLIMVNDKILLWVYPYEIFEMFKKVYILTYMFEASILKYYFDAYKIKYQKKSISYDKENDKYYITGYYKPDVSHFKNLINMEDSPDSPFEQKSSALSKSWFTAECNKDNIKKLQKTIYSYIRNTIKAKSDSVLWTTFISAKGRLKGKGYTKSFIACNSRATNQYSDRYNLVYALNIYVNPGIDHFLMQRDAYLDRDMYALSELVQWIWRSRIRKGESINLYIASDRMKRLFVDWLDNKF